MKTGIVHATIYGALFLFVTSGCSNAFKTVSAPSTACTGPDCNGGLDTGGDTKPLDWNMRGTIGSGRFATLPVLSLDKTTKTLMIRLPLMANPALNFNGEIPVPDIPGAKITFEQLKDSNGVTTPAVALHIPLDRFLKGLEFSAKDRLPNGDPLPDVAGGELPSTAVTLLPIGNVRATIYLGPSVVAVFVSTPFDPAFHLPSDTGAETPGIQLPPIPIRDPNMTQRYGSISIIPEKKGAGSGGFYITAKVPDEIARAIDDVL